MDNRLTLVRGAIEADILHTHSVSVDGTGLRHMTALHRLCRHIVPVDGIPVGAEFMPRVLIFTDLPGLIIPFIPTIGCEGMVVEARTNPSACELHWHDASNTRKEK